jgi:hypothetical protein
MRYLRLIIEIPLAIFEWIIWYIHNILIYVRDASHDSYRYDNWIKRDLSDCQSILELGCGSNSPVLRVGYGKRTTAIDVCKPYVDIHNARKDYCKCTELDILKANITPKSFDAVIMCDVLEHLDRKDVERIDLFGQIERCARKRVVLFTPNGYTDNDEVDGGKWQKHQSSWEPEDYTKRGYTVVGATGWRKIVGKAALPNRRPYNLFFLLAILTQPLVFNHPNQALHSYAVLSCDEKTPHFNIKDELGS